MENGLISIVVSGRELLENPLLNKGTAFTQEERDAFALNGLLPPHILSIDEQIDRRMEALRALPTDFDRHVFMRELQDTNETLYYALLTRNIEELLPIIYTPSVGAGCQRFSRVYKRPRGLFLSLTHQDKLDEIFANPRFDNIECIVVTDGERILGLGDLGAGGMGIPIGKLAIYSGAGGIDPATTLPITLDVGTNNAELLADPLYIGLHQQRTTGKRYDDFVEAFIQAVIKRWPNVLLQWEDFHKNNASRLLERYRDRLCCFNDDIQGTAAVTVSGILSALRITGGTLRDQRFLFLGAGEAGMGAGELLVTALMEEGLSVEEARRCCWYFDSKGLVVQSRLDLVGHKRQYAHDHPQVDNFLGAIEALRPHGIIGVSGQAKRFSPEVLEAMARINERPIVFSLSNPTSKAECTAEEAYIWTQGRAIFASGSPFPPVVYSGRKMFPGQGNNVYIFPGVGMGVMASGAARVTDEMFLVAARVVAGEVTEADLNEGRLYPPLPRIREVALAVAEAVAEVAYRRGLAGQPRPDDLRAHIISLMYEPMYPNYV